MWDWLVDYTDGWGSHLGAIVLICVLGLFIRWILHRIINRLVKGAESGVLPERLQSLESTNTVSRRVQRARTVGTLMRSVVSIVVVVVVGLMVLAEVGVNIAPLLASAGILGVALGFGSQSLVKDFLSGVFMMFEDQYGVGDEVDLGDASGTVEAVSLRVTRLRDVNGTVWYVRNGEVLRVGNMSQNWARTVLDVVVAHGSDLGQVRDVLQRVAHDLWENADFKNQILEEPEVWGVQDLAPEGVTMRVTLKTAPLKQWTVARAMRERIKEEFDADGIQMPSPQRVTWTREDSADEERT